MATDQQTERLTKKMVFARPTAGELRERVKSEALELVVGIDHACLRETAHTIHSLKENQVYQLNSVFLDPSVPAQWYKKHLDYLRLSARRGKTARERLEHVLRDAPIMCISGYGWHDGQNNRRRIVPFQHLLSAAQIFAYEANKDPRPEVGIYPSRENGIAAEAHVRMSAREEKEKNKIVKIVDIPLVPQAKWEHIDITTICCKNKEYADTRAYREGEARRKIFCEHEIAAYWLAADVFVQQGNTHPARMTPFDYPSQELIDFYKKLDRGVFLRDPKSKKWRVLHENEQEWLLYAFITTHGYKHAFSGKDKLSERDWK